MAQDIEGRKLLVQFEDWMDREGITPDEEWVSSGIELSRKLLRLEPENVQYKTNLAKLLLDLGRDEKLIKENYRRARELFLEVLQVSPSNSFAHYHLGWIESFNKRWEASIRHFQKALQSELLPLSSRVRALANLSISYSNIGMEKEAHDYYEAARETDVHKECTTEIEFVRLSLGASNHAGVSYGDFVINTNGNLRMVSWEEANEAVRDSTGYLVLDRLDQDQLFHPDNPVPMPLDPREADLLEYLLKKPGIHRTDAIRRSIWPGSRSQVVKSYIRRVRQNLAECFDCTDNEVMEHILVTVEGGYAWRDQTPYRIIRLGRISR